MCLLLLRLHAHLTLKQNGMEKPSNRASDTMVACVQDSRFMTVHATYVCDVCSDRLVVREEYFGFLQWQPVQGRKGWVTVCASLSQTQVVCALNCDSVSVHHLVFRHQAQPHDRSIDQSALNTTAACNQVSLGILEKIRSMERGTNSYRRILKIRGLIAYSYLKHHRPGLITYSSANMSMHLRIWHSVHASIQISYMKISVHGK